MARKSKRKPEPQAHEVSLDDPRWRLPLLKLHALLSDLLGSPYDAAAELNGALADKSAPLPSLIEFPPGKRRLLPTNFYADHSLHQDMTRWVVGTGRALEGSLTSRGCRFFVWVPAAAKRWPELDLELAPATDETRSKPGPKETGNWSELLAEWLKRVQEDEPYRLDNIDKLTNDAQDFLLNKIKWAPSDRKAFRKKIGDLVRDLRS